MMWKIERKIPKRILRYGEKLGADIIAEGFCASLSQYGFFKIEGNRIFQIYPRWVFYPTQIVAIKEEKYEKVMTILKG